MEGGLTAAISLLHWQTLEDEDGGYSCEKVGGL
jgi:hypothetical protein